MIAQTNLKAALTISVFFVVLAFAAPPRYEIIDLGTLGGDWSIAYSINDNGQIVGLAHNSSDDLCATLFDPTGAGNNIDLGTLGSQKSEAYSINDMGQIVGSADGLATLFDPTGSGNNIDLGMLSGDPQSVASSINNNGQIVGWSGYFLAKVRATLFDPNGSGNNIELGTLGGSRSSALSINDIGHIVGWAQTRCTTPFCSLTFRATLFDTSGNGRNTNLGKLPGGWEHSRAHSINNNGQIVGMAFNGSANKISAARAALFFPGDKNIDLGTLGGYSSYADCINDKGQIVGSAGGRATLFDPSGNGNNIDLNTLIDPNSGWSLEEAWSINNHGWIVGRGYCTSIGDTHAYLLIPEPVNTDPVACIVGGDRTVEAQGHWGATVILDGSCSADADSTPGTNDDINDFNWYQVDPYDPNFADFLTSGQVIDCNLSLGEHLIILEVIDKAGASDTNEVAIAVQDTIPPTINNVSATPDVLWPPNHNMVEVTVTVDAEDLCDPVVICRIVDVTSNEPINGPGDGNTGPDWNITGDLMVNLRAERAAIGTSRVYIVHIECTDASGNTAAAAVEVNVPHDQGKAKK